MVASPLENQKRLSWQKKQSNREKSRKKAYFQRRSAFQEGAHKKTASIQGKGALWKQELEACLRN